jgi:hypothetical protein
MAMIMTICRFIDYFVNAVWEPPTRQFCFGRPGSPLF